MLHKPRIVNKYLQTAVVIDSNPSLRNDLKIKLRDIGITPLKTFASAASAVQYINADQKKVDLVVLGIRTEDGLASDVVQLLKANPFFEQSFIYYISEPDTLREAEDALKAGSCGICVRPFPVKELIDSLEPTFMLYHLGGGDSEIVNQKASLDFYRRIGDFHMALKFCQRVLEKIEMGTTYYDLGKTCADLGRAREAMLAFTRAVKLQPSLKMEIRNYMKKNPLENKEKVTDKIPSLALAKFALDKGLLLEKFYKPIHLNSVLIANPDIEERRAIIKVLAEQKVDKIREAESFEEFLLEIKERPSDMVIMSYKWPDRDHLDLIFSEQIENSNFMTAIKVFSFHETEFPANYEELFNRGLDWAFVFPHTHEDMRYQLHEGLNISDLLVLTADASAAAKAAWFSYLLNDFETSAKLAKLGWSKNPFDGICLMILAMSLQWQEHKDSLDFYKKAIQNMPVLKPVCMRVRSDIAAYFERDGGAPEKSSLIFGKALPILSENEKSTVIPDVEKSDGNRPSAEECLRKAKDHLKSGRLNSATSFCEKAIAEDEAFAEAYNVLGITYRRHNLPDKAIESYEMAIELEPDNHKFLHNLAVAYQKTNQMKKAKQMFERSKKAKRADAKLAASRPATAVQQKKKVKPSENKKSPDESTQQTAQEEVKKTG